MLFCKQNGLKYTLFIILIYSILKKYFDFLLFQIVELIKEYLSCSGEFEGIDQLEHLCQRMQTTDDQDQLLSINKLLQDFTELSLEKKQKEQSVS